MIVLTKEQILKIHSQLIAATGGSDGVRDEALLDSAINTPFQSFSGVDVYPSILQKGARLGYGLIKNHAFIDGNKRIGTHCMLVFFMLNNIELDYTQEELIDIVMNTASGKCDFDEFLNWIISHSTT